MFLSYAWKGLTRRKSRTMLTVLGIFFSTGLLVAVLSILNYYVQLTEIPFSASGADMVVDSFVEPGPWKNVRLARHLGPLSVDIGEKIKKMPEVEDVSGLLLFWSWENDVIINVAGVNPNKIGIGPCCRISKQPEYNMSAMIIEGRELQPTDKKVALLDKMYAAHTKLSIGDTIRIGGEPFEVIGLADIKNVVRVGQMEVYIPLSEAQRIVKASHDIKADNFVNMFMVKFKPGVNPENLKGNIKKIVGESAGIDPEKQVLTFTSKSIMSNVSGVTKLMQDLFKIIAIIMIVGVTLLVVKAALISVNERTEEIGIMKASGWAHSSISRLIVFEMALQGFIGGLLGCVAGYAIAFSYASSIKISWPHGMLPYSCVPASVPPSGAAAIDLGISWPLVGVTMGIAVIIGIVGGLIAARKAKSLKPADALRKV